MGGATELDQRELESLRLWVGRTVETQDTVTAGPARGLAAMLGLQDGDAFLPGTPLPALWHWLYCLPRPGRADLGPDGHARSGYGLPPVPFPRRMWAGGALRFHARLKIGALISRRSTVRSVEHKRGRSGELLFFTVEHRILEQDRLLLEERQDIVYRPALASGRGPLPEVPHDPRLDDGSVPRLQFTPTETDLFRYSALTFNSHRIHYDLPFAREREGHPGLVVHGPLIATLLAAVAERTLSQPLSSFEFRAIAPAFHGKPLDLRSSPSGSADGTLTLCARNARGGTSMEARAAAQPGAPAAP